MELPQQPLLEPLFVLSIMDLTNCPCKFVSQILLSVHFCAAIVFCSVLPTILWEDFQEFIMIKIVVMAVVMITPWNLKPNVT